MLHGTRGRTLPNGFTLLEDGAQGLRHALPLPMASPTADMTSIAQASLCVRHYINKTGFARPVASRLVGFASDQVLSRE